MTMSEIGFDDWLDQTDALRTKLYNFGKSPLPIEPGHRHLDMDAAIQSADDAGRLLADLDSYLTQHTAQAVLEVKKQYEDNSADERKILVKDRVRGIQLIRDAMAITQRTIRDRLYTSMNTNRSR